MQIDSLHHAELTRRYLEVLEDEGVLNEVIFGRPEWDEDPNGRYTMEYHGVDKLTAMVSDDVLARQFGEWKCCC